MDYEYRFLPSIEWDTLHIEKKFIPRPDTARCVVARLDGKIVGYLFVQLAPHVEPLQIDPEHRGKVNWHRMIEMAAETLPEGAQFYAFAPNVRIAALLSAYGKVERMPWFIFRSKEK